MSTSIKIYSALSTLVVIGSITYRTSKFFIEEETNQNHLISFEYKYLGDPQEDKFDRWKVNYSLFKRHLLKNISLFKNIDSDSRGAYLLKRWCSERINKNISTKDLRLIKKYCVVNLKHMVLNNDKTRTIDNMESKERKKHFCKNKNNCNKELKSLNNWCNTNFKLAYIPSNNGILEKIKSNCAIVI